MRSVSNRILYIGKQEDFLKILLETKGKAGEVYQLSNAIEGFDWLRMQIEAPLLVIIDKACAGVEASFISKLFLKRFKHWNLRIALLVQKDEDWSTIAASSLGIVEIFQLSKINTQISRLTFLLQPPTSTIVQQEAFMVRPLALPIWKRTFDIVASLAAIILLSPILIIVAILIKLDSKGDVLYTSKRIGRGYQMFDFYKFRTMRVGAANELNDLKKELNQYNKAEDVIDDKKKVACSCDKCIELVSDGMVIRECYYQQQQAEENTAFVKLSNDPRITRLGRFLRNSSIDELPQLFNILKGDMSVVGNRPLPLYEAKALTTDEASARFQAPAGLTGLWQVKKRGQKDMSEEERRNLDNTYAENFSFIGDLSLIFATLGVFFQKENV